MRCSRISGPLRRCATALLRGGKPVTNAMAIAPTPTIASEPGSGTSDQRATAGSAVGETESVCDYELAPLSLELNCMLAIDEPPPPRTHKASVDRFDCAAQQRIARASNFDEPQGLVVKVDSFVDRSSTCRST